MVNVPLSISLIKRDVTGGTTKIPTNCLTICRLCSVTGAKTWSITKSHTFIIRKSNCKIRSIHNCNPTFCIGEKVIRYIVSKIAHQKYKFWLKIERFIQTALTPKPCVRGYGFSRNARYILGLFRNVKMRLDSCFRKLGVLSLSRHKSVSLWSGRHEKGGRRRRKCYPAR